MKPLPVVVRTAISLLLVAGGIGGLVLMGSAEAPEDPNTEAKIPTVATEIARQHDDGIRFSVDGVVVPYRVVPIAAEVAGRIEFKADNCRVGKIVESGQRLLAIDRSDYDFELQRLQKELEQSEASLKELEVEAGNIENQIALARSDLEIRQRELKRYTSDEGLFSQADIDAARRNELAARNSLQALTDQLRLTKTRSNRLESARALVETQVGKAQLDLRRTEISSPLSGVVVSESVEQDGYVQKGAVVVTIQDTSKLEVTCKLHMHQMNWLWQSQTAEASDEGSQTAYSFPKSAVDVAFRLGDTSFVWKGVLERYDGAGVDEQTRMIPCRVHVEDPLTVEQMCDHGSSTRHANPPTLMTGMFVQVQICAYPGAKLIRLSPPAVQPGNTVWIVKGDKLQRTQVRIAHADQKQVLIYDNSLVEDGSQVVVSPLASPVAGQRVEVQAAE